MPPFKFTLLKLYHFANVVVALCVFYFCQFKGAKISDLHWIILWILPAIAILIYLGHAYIVNKISHTGVYAIFHSMMEGTGQYKRPKMKNTPPLTISGSASTEIERLDLSVGNPEILDGLRSKLEEEDVDRDIFDRCLLEAIQESRGGSNS